MITAIAELFFSAIGAIRAIVAIVAIIWKTGFKLPVSLRQVADIMYQSITKLPMPPHRPLGIWLFLKGFGQILGYVGSLDGQIPHRLALQKVSNPAFHQRLFMVKNFSMRQTVYSNLNILLNTTEISKSRKTVLRRFFIPITLFISESPHLTGPFKLRANGRNVGSCSPTMLRPFARSFKGSQMLQQNSEHRSNDVNNPWT